MTRASDTRPTRREVNGQSHGPLVVDVGADVVRIRPKGRRAAGLVVELPWGALYLHAIASRVDAERRERARRRKTRAR